MSPRSPSPNRRAILASLGAAVPAAAIAAPAVAATLAPPADPHLALLPALRQAFAWVREVYSVSDRCRAYSLEDRASTAVFQHYWSVADRILALPAPQTPAGLGAVALALSARFEGSIGQDPERYEEERRVASAIRAMMSVAGAVHFPGWFGFGDEPDSEAQWKAMLERAGEGSLPAWALAGKSGPDASDLVAGGQA